MMGPAVVAVLPVLAEVDLLAALFSGQEHPFLWAGK